MTAQPQLFYEDIFEVVRAAVQAAGGAKVVAAKLWPHKPAAEAQRELLDCLNRDRPQKLCIEEFMAVLRWRRTSAFIRQRTGSTMHSATSRRLRKIRRLNATAWQTSWRAPRTTLGASRGP
jgi:hypothetical protein